MEHENDANLSGAPYAFYQHEDGHYTDLPYAPTHMSYPVVPNTQTPEMLQMRQLSLMSHQSYQHQPPTTVSNYPTSPTRVAASMQLPPSPSPVDPAAYEHPISPPVSGSDASTDSQTHYQHSYSRESSSGAGSPPSNVRGSGSSLVHRSQHRYNPTASAPRTRRRRSSTNDDGDLSDDGEQEGSGIGLSPQSTGGMSMHVSAQSLANERKEATRRQRIEAEQRRRDELREGYARLKDVLPLSNQKSSKVSLLERATHYISTLDQNSKILQARLSALEAEVARLRDINERLSLIAQHTGQMPPDMDLGLPPPPHQHFDDPNMEQRPLSPPPDVHPPPSSHPHSSQNVQQPQHHHHQPQHESLYHHRNDSSASGSQASGSEY